MKKVSDDARSKLNELGFSYFVFFVLMFFLCATTATKSTSNPNGTELFSLAIVIFMSYTWIFKRSKIIRDNKDDIKKEHAIENYYTNIKGEKLVVTTNSWLDKKFTSVCFVDAKEENEIKKNSFSYEISLSRIYSYINNVCQKIETNVSLNITSDKMVKIDGIDCLAILPHPNSTKKLLAEIFGFISCKYHNQKQLSLEKPDYTLSCINNALLKNYENAIKTFLSGEEFQVAGKMIKVVGIDKKIFLITAVRVERGYFALLPIKTIEDIFSRLSDIVLKNEI